MRKIFFLIILVFLLGSCRKLVQDEFADFEKSTTINTILANDSIISVHISETQGINENPLSVIIDADVSLFINDSLVILNYTNDGLYTANINSRAETNYRCEVKVKDRELTTAECFIPQTPVLISIYFDNNGWINSDGAISPSVGFTIKNDIDKIMYFQAVVTVVDNLFDQELADYADSIALILGEIINSKNSYKKSIGLFTNNEETNNSFYKSINFSLNSWGTTMDNTFIFELRALSEDAYKYKKSVELYKLGRNPEFGTGSVVPHNLYSNIKNGYGIFAGYSSVLSDSIRDNKKY